MIPFRIDQIHHAAATIIPMKIAGTPKEFLEEVSREGGQ
jgi:hypothetical protein